MKKNQKILVAVLAIVIVLAVVIFAIAMNKNTNEETSNSTNVETSEVVSTSESTKVESSTEVIASIGTAPEDSQSSIDKSGAINFPGSETSESSTSETETSESTTESSTSKTESTTESTTSKTETSTSETSTSDSSTSKTETSTSETSTSTEPTTSESSTTPSTPVDNSSTIPSTPAGEQITQGSTGTTSLGTTYPIVSEFNKVGLNPDSVSFGSTDGSSNDFAKAFGQANRSLSDVLGYPSTQIAINATNTYISYGDAHISRKPESGYYVFVYAANIVDTSDGGTSSRAAHQVMLGAITSTPAEVENALFQAMWGDDPYNIGSCQWVTVGDCQILYGYGNASESEFYYEFAIRPKN